MIVTCRPVWEGGQFSGSEEERRRFLSEAVELGAEYVDIEWRAHFDDLIARTAGRRIVRDAAAKDYRWSALILGIVNSPTFLMQGAP